MDLKTRIVEEATQLFLRYGVKSIRMDDIATRMGVSKRTLYELFSDRENLITACIEYYHKKQHERHNERIACCGNVMELFILLLNDYEDAIQSNINFMTDLTRFYPKLHEKLVAIHYKEGVDRLKSQLEQGIKEGLFLPDLDVDASSSILAGALSNLFMNPSTYQVNNISQAEAFRYILMCFFRGISTSKGMRIIDRIKEESGKRKGDADKGGGI